MSGLFVKGNIHVKYLRTKSVEQVMNKYGIRMDVW